MRAGPTRASSRGVEKGGAPNQGTPTADPCPPTELTDDGQHPVVERARGGGQRSVPSQPDPEAAALGLALARTLGLEDDLCWQAHVTSQCGSPGGERRAERGKKAGGGRGERLASDEGGPEPGRRGDLRQQEHGVRDPVIDVSRVCRSESACTAFRPKTRRNRSPWRERRQRKPAGSPRDSHEAQVERGS